APPDDGRAQHARGVTCDLNVQIVIDNIDDFVDDERHRAATVGENQKWLRTLTFYVNAVAHADERHEMSTVLDHVTAVRELDFLRVNFLKPRDERQRHRLRLSRSGAKHQ